MNLIMRALDQDKQRIKEFPVSFYENKMAIIYEFSPEHSIFLENLVNGINEIANEKALIICTPSQIFTSIEKFQKVKYEDKIELIDPKKDLPTIILPV